MKTASINLGVKLYEVFIAMVTERRYEDVTDKD